MAKKWLHEKEALVLMTLKEMELYGEVAYIQKLAKKTDTTYNHLLKVIKKLEERGLIKTELNKRVRKIYLTEKGDYLAKLCLEISINLN